MVLTADCLPILLCDKEGTQVAAIHAGWRGLLDGVIESTIKKMGGYGSELIAWYAERFGVAPDSQDDGSHLASIPGSELRFEDTEKDRLSTDGTAIDHIGFEIQEWDAFVETLQEAGIQFEFGPVYIESLDLWVAFFNDPAGVLVEITHGLDQF